MYASFEELRIPLRAACLAGLMHSLLYERVSVSCLVACVHLHLAAPMNAAGKKSLAMQAFARALRALPATICDNAGLDRFIWCWHSVVVVEWLTETSPRF
jgi:hypothetical protein